MNLKHETNRIMGCMGMEAETFESEVEAILYGLISWAERRGEDRGHKRGFGEGKIEGYDIALKEITEEKLFKQGVNDNE
jgi:hypothetical protein